jgi:hypothetical protein
MSHAFGEVTFHRLDHQMIVIGHEAEGMAYPIKTLNDLSQYRQKLLTIFIIFENRLTPVTS